MFKKILIPLLFLCCFLFWLVYDVLNVANCSFYILYFVDRCTHTRVQIREGGSKSASGYGPGVQIRGGSKSAVTPALYGSDAPRSIVFEIVSRTARLMVKYLKTEDLSYFNLSIIYRDFSSLKKEFLMTSLI